MGQFRSVARRTVAGAPLIGQMNRSTRQHRVLAVASGGGHWVQLQRLTPAFDGQDVAYLTTDPGYRSEVGDARFHVVNDANRWNKMALILCALRVLWVVLRERPDIVISTGAAPGYLAIRWARLLGARTVWIDSIANVDELSMSGRMASTAADLCLTQWPHLAAGQVRYLGAVL
jgi:UDP-N-acetylglucosamine:LPS N-acetylglucosamine transferase